MSADEYRSTNIARRHYLSDDCVKVFYKDKYIDVFTDNIFRIYVCQNNESRKYPYAVMIVCGGFYDNFFDRWSNQELVFSVHSKKENAVRQANDLEAAILAGDCSEYEGSINMQRRRPDLSNLSEVTTFSSRPVCIETKKDSKEPIADIDVKHKEERSVKEKKPDPESIQECISIMDSYKNSIAPGCEIYDAYKSICSNLQNIEKHCLAAKKNGTSPSLRKAKKKICMYIPEAAKAIDMWDLFKSEDSAKNLRTKIVEILSEIDHLTQEAFSIVVDEEVDAAEKEIDNLRTKMMLDGFEVRMD